MLSAKFFVLALCFICLGCGRTDKDSDGNHPEGKSASADKAREEASSDSENSESASTTDSGGSRAESSQTPDHDSELGYNFTKLSSLSFTAESLTSETIPVDDFKEIVVLGSESEIICTYICSGNWKYEMNNMPNMELHFSFDGETFGRTTQEFQAGNGGRFRTDARHLKVVFPGPRAVIGSPSGSADKCPLKSCTGSYNLQVLGVAD